LLKLRLLDLLALGPQLVYVSDALEHCAKGLDIAKEELVHCCVPELGLSPLGPLCEGALVLDLVEEELQALDVGMADTLIKELCFGDSYKKLQELVANQRGRGVVIRTTTGVVAGGDEQTVDGGETEGFVDEAGLVAEVADGSGRHARIQKRLSL